MNILYVMDCKIDLIGGSQKSTITTINGMLENGVNVSMICEEPNDKEFYFYKKNVKFNFFKKKKNKFVNLISKMFYLRKHLKNNDIDIVHVQNTRFFVITAFALKFHIIRKKNIKFIYTDRDFYDAYTKTYRFLIKKLASKFDIIVCTTPINQNLWKNFHNHVHLISNALEEEWFKYDAKRKKNNKKYKIGFCGRFVKYKRWDNVLKICDDLKGKFDFSFAISLANEYEKAEFNLYKSKLDKILGGKYDLIINADKNEIVDFYYGIDIFILTSEKESFGRTLIEAMTKYNIVFGTNSGGVPFVIKDANFLFDVDNLKDLYEKINNATHSNKEVLKLKQHFYNFSVSNYNADNMINEYLLLYKGVNE